MTAAGERGPGDADPDSYFVRVGANRFRPTLHTAGAWSTAEQHFSPLAGLLTHAVDRFVAARGPDSRVDARLSFDILGTVGIEEFDVAVDVVRPGKTVELVEAVAEARGRAFVRARIWRLERGETSAIADGQPDPLPPPDHGEPWALTSVWPGGYIASLDVRGVGERTAGRSTVWIRTPVALVAGEPASDLARYVGLLDTANGIAVRRPPETWFYPNVDLTVSFYRQPGGEWVGLDTTVVFGPEGQGVTSTTLHDETGPVGIATQTLTIRSRDAR
jgi:hypothetical protein